METRVAIIPKPEQLTCMEAFRDAIINNKSLQDYYLDDLSEVYKLDIEDWHEAFVEYHDLLTEYQEIPIGLVTNGFWIDDIQFFMPEHPVVIKLVL